MLYVAAGWFVERQGVVERIIRLKKTRIFAGRGSSPHRFIDYHEIREIQLIDSTKSLKSFNVLSNHVVAASSIP